MKSYIHSMHYRRGLTLPNPLKLVSKLLFWRRLRKQNRLVYAVIGIILIIIIGIYAYSLIFPAQKTEAAWFDESFAYRQRLNITNSGSVLTDYQISFFFNTSSLISAGKMNSNCSDIRITDNNGNPIPFWLENGAGVACNTSSTRVWVKIPTVYNPNTYVYIYYGNASAQNAASGTDVFELFDDFTGSTVDNSIWTGDTTGFSIVAGLLHGSSTTYRLQSQKTFTGNYEVITRMFTTTQATNGHMPIGFYGSTSNAFGLLDHFTSSWYYRNDSSWVNISAPTNNQWIRVSAKVAGTSASYGMTGETSGSNSGLGITNSGLSSESIALGLRYDGCCTGESYDADWDWVAVRKAAATEPGIGSPGNEETSPGPLAYWRFDEGTGTVASDSSSNRNNATLTSMTWKQPSDCISDNCVSTDANSDRVTTGSSAKFNPYSAMTMSTWYKLSSSYTTNASYRWPIIMTNKAGDTHTGWGIRYQITPNSTANTGLLYFEWGQSPCDGSTYTSLSIKNGVIYDDTWHHVAVTYDGTTIKAYLDGVQVASTTQGGGFCNIGSNSMYMADRTNYSGTPNIAMDETKIYGYARTANQIQTDFVSRGGTNGSSSILGVQDLTALSKGLVGYWNMDESSWTNDCSTGSVTDSSGNGNNGRSCPNAAGVSTLSLGKYGHAPTLDGTNDYISVPASGVFDNQRLTIAAWVYSTNFSQNGFIFEKTTNGSVNTQYSCFFEGANLIFRTYNNSSTIDSLVLAWSGWVTNSQWNHIACVYDGVKKYIYINGREATSAAYSQTLITNSAGTSFIGAYGGGAGYWFNGKIDEVRVYNRGLAPNEVSLLYNTPPSPISYWAMEEKTGNTISDSSGNGNTSSAFTGNTAWGAGKVGNGLVFDGNDDVVRIPETTLTDLGATSDSFTLSAWIKTTFDSSAIQEVVAKDPNTGGYIRFGLNGGEAAAIQISDGTQTALCGSSNKALNDGKWHHIAGVRDVFTDTLYVYVDGVLVCSTTDTTTTTIQNNTDWSIGNGGTSYNQLDFNGSIDEVKIYNYARSQKQIVQDMNGGHPAGGSPVGSAVGYWKFDEGYGTSANNSGTSVNDNRGTLSNMDSPASLTSGWTTQGKLGKALRFDGTNDTVSIANTSSMINLVSTTPPSFTLSAWFNPSSSSNDLGGITLMSASVNARLYHRTATNQFCFQLKAASTSVCTGTNSTMPTSWYHITAVYDKDAALIKIYLNGKLISTGTPADTNLSAAAMSMVIGNAQGYFSGAIDEVKLYTYALTDNEVGIDYNRSSSQVLGSLSDTSGLTGGTVASNSAAAAYCIPGDTTSCNAPLAEWNFEEGQGTSVNDVTGNGNTGTWSGSSTNRWTTGKYGKGGNLLQSNLDLVDIGSPALLQLTSTITVSAWVNLNDYAVFNEAIAKSNNLFTLRSFELRVDQTTGLPRFIVYAGGSCTSYSAADTAALSTRTWHHLVGVYDGSSAKLYVDGVLKATNSSATGTICNATQNLALGALGFATGGTGFNGKLDQVRVYNYSRSAAQVAWEYNQGKPIGWWKADECQGSTLNDTSGNGGPATITIGASGSQTSVGSCIISSSAWNNGVNGKLNYSLNFDGTDDYTQTTTTSILNTISTDTSPMTISAWIKRSATGATHYILNKQQNTTNQFLFGLRISSSNLAEFSLGKQNVAASDLTGTSTISSGQWYHILATFDGTTQKLYVNGKLENTRTKNASIASSTANTADLYFGKQYNNTNYFAGQIDDVRIFNYPLTTAQINTLYNNGAVQYSPVTGAP